MAVDRAPTAEGSAHIIPDCENLLFRRNEQWKRIYVDDQGNTTEGLAQPSQEHAIAFESTGPSGSRLRWSLVGESERRIHSITERSRDAGQTWKIVSTLTLERVD